MRHYSQRKILTKKPRNQKHINPGDLICFYEDNRVWPADEKTWEYNENIQRIIYSGEPLVYVKGLKNKEKFFHHFICLGLAYVLCGPYNVFHKM